MKELSQVHEDSIDRSLLNKVPIEPSDYWGKRQVYRWYQFLHTLRNYSQILKLDPNHDPVHTWENEGGR